jgi:hypothetical protein
MDGQTEGTKTKREGKRDTPRERGRKRERSTDNSSAFGHQFTPRPERLPGQAL